MAQLAIGSANPGHTFFVVPDMNRNFILGQDWLEQNGVRMYIDLGCIRVIQTYVPLQDDMFISSIARAHAKTKIKTPNGCNLQMSS